MKNFKSPVKLRKKKLANGNDSLYLDIYFNGCRKYEYLGMYLVPPINAINKDINKRTLLAAEQIKSERLLKLMEETNEFFRKTKKKNKTIKEFILEKFEKKDFITYIVSRINKFDIDFKFSDLSTQKEFDEWREKCLQGLNSNSRYEYNIRIKTILALAQKDSLIPLDITVPKVKKIESPRQFLTIEEVKTLDQTPCYDSNLKNAFLFSCFTGLRISDVKKLRWKDVSEVDSYTRITFIQKKTKRLEYMDICQQAAYYLNQQPRISDYVFEISRSALEKTLPQWLGCAGINKKITFHCARHTFAVMMVDIGTDLFVVSKLLGHSNIQTTQVYAKVLDQTKRKAIDNIPNFEL